MNDDGAHVVGVEGAHAPEEEEEGRGVVGHAVVGPRGELQLSHVARCARALGAARVPRTLHEERAHRVVSELLRVHQRHGDLAAVHLCSCTHSANTFYSCLSTHRSLR